MLGRVAESRALARAAVAGLTAGLLVLITLALWGTARTEQATAELREMNELNDGWGRVYEALTIVDEALHDYERAGSDIGRQPVASAVTATADRLLWVEQHGQSADAEAVRTIRQTFDSYRLSLQQLYAAGRRGDLAQVSLQVEQASLGVAALRKQSAASMSRGRVEIMAFLDTVDRSNRRLRAQAALAALVELVLLSVFASMLLRYQRRVERQAAGSRHQALHDSLTGLANRVLLADRVEQAVRGRRRGDDEHVGLLLIDLDRFKEINDTLGHHHGDLLLVEVAARLRSCVRGVDTVARLGGDEFAVLLAQTASVADATAVAQRLLTSLREPVDLDGVVVEVGASIGVTVYPEHSADASELLKHADIAMYAAKRGRRGVVAYEPGLNGHSVRQLTLLGELRGAIDRGELVLHYQPLAGTADGAIRGVEALVRWAHPEHGLLGPDQFIPLAEQGELIEPLTAAVLADALRQCAAWEGAGHRLPVAVNIATRCLLDPQFPALVAGLLAEHGVPAERLTLEVTENALITEPARAVQVLGQLRDQGVRLSIDDFGTGYASMAYVRTLPVHELKIDRSYVSALLSSQEDRAIVRAVLTLAHNLDLEVVAEGVEDEATWAELARLDCDLVQGYYLSRPMPAADVPGWLQQHSAAQHRYAPAPTPA